jgi:putative phage-type endonuclease
MDQRSADWFAARCGKVTASRIADLMAKTKSGYSTSRANYRAQLVVERLTGEVEPSYCNAAMQHGIDTEAEAREAYEQHMLYAVNELGFADHPTIEMAGASPDGLVGDDGLVEIKCPITATHIDTLLSGGVADKYLKQMQFQMACTGRTWCDFVSYDNRLPEPMRLFVQRVPRDDAFIREIEAEVVSFLAEVEDHVAQLRTKFELGATLAEAIAA